MIVVAAPDISVIIPTYNRRDSVERALLALARQTLPPERYETIVVIDGSEDGTRELVGAFKAPYALHCLWQANAGRAAAINAGSRAARGAILALLDDDMEAAPQYLAAHWQAHQRSARVGVIGAAPIRLAATVPPVVADYIGPKFNAHLQKLAQPEHKLVLRDFYSGNFSIARDLLLEVGAFDEAFKVYGNEDLELSYRLTRAGVQLVYCAEALAYQAYTKTFTGLAQDTMSKGRTAVMLASKHPKTAAELQLSRYREVSKLWGSMRAVLLKLTQHWPPMAKVAVAVTLWLEPIVAGRPLRYRLALDYCYWVGVEAALRDNQRAGQGLQKLSDLARS